MNGDLELVRFAVERREGTILILEGPNGNHFEIDEQILPVNCRAPGALLDIPVWNGDPRWEAAVRDVDSELSLQRQLKERILRLGRQDPGGDINL